LDFDVGQLLLGARAPGVPLESFRILSEVDDAFFVAVDLDV
jgi:hypothetical protein